MCDLGNTNLHVCWRTNILALLHSTTANKIDSEHIRDYKKLLMICDVELLQVFSPLRLISEDFRLKSAENS